MPDSGMNQGSSLSRRPFVGGAAVGTPAPHPQTPDEAVQILREGNQRYLNGQLELRDFSPVGEQIASKQAPFVAIITCADSRISPALLFDVIGGNLFVSRIAGNSIDTGTLGSTEYAVAVLGVQLILVLGHSDCGAVKAAISVADGSESFPPSRYGAIGPVVDLIVPSVKALPADQRDLAHATVKNAEDQAKIIEAKDPIIAPAVKAGKLKVISAVYDLVTGQVSL
jgi:carbonic anhydrase